MTEFNLSKNIHKVDLDYLDEDDNDFATYEAIEVSKIKEFIRLLKEELNNLFEWGIETKNINPNLADEIIEKIDELAGEKLC